MPFRGAANDSTYHKLWLQGNRTFTKISCLRCNNQVLRPVSDVRRGRYKFCSLSCSVSFTKTGKPSWNKGLTKEQDSRVKKYAEKHAVIIKRLSAEGKLKGNTITDKKGANNPNWRGGVTSENELLRRSPRYKQWRKAVFERDNYTCQECDQWGGELQADHIKPWRSHINLRFEISNGKTLCKPCHLKTPTWGASAKKTAYYEKVGIL